MTQAQPTLPKITSSDTAVSALLVRVESASAVAAKKIVKEPGQPFLIQGDPVTGIYRVDRGRVGVYPQGAKSPINYIEVGGVFGDMAFLDKAPASATIRAESLATTVAFFSFSAVQGVMTADPAWGMALYQALGAQLSEKIRTTNQRITAELTKVRELLADLKLEGKGDAEFTLLTGSLHKDAEHLRASIDSAAKALAGTGPQRDAKVIAEELKASLELFARLTSQMDAKAHLYAKFMSFVEKTLLQPASS